MTQPPERRKEDAWLDQMLDEVAQADVGDAPDALLARVMADGAALLPAPGGTAVRTPWWRQVVDALGGTPAVGGLVAAAATGFVIGIGGIEPAAFDDFLAADTDTYFESQDAFSAFGWDMEDG